MTTPVTSHSTADATANKPNHGPLALAILMIAVGVGWLMTAIGVGPEINWIWTVGLGTLGVLAFVLCGFDKVSVLLGGFFLSASGLSILRQTERIDWNVEVPVLVILLGMLLLVAQSRAIPFPDWVRMEQEPPV